MFRHVYRLFLNFARLYTERRPASPRGGGAKGGRVSERPLCKGTSLHLLLARQNDALDDEEQADHRSDGDLGPPCVGEAGGGDDVLDGAQGQDAEERADDVTHATGEHRAADDGRRDGVHLHAVRVGDGAGARSA